MKKAACRFLTVFTLMSRIPVRKKFEVDFTHADFWIPAISPLVSLSALAGFLAGVFLTRSVFLGALTSVAAQYFLFNLFHLDGLVDTADAMLPVAGAEKRLDILKDPRMGTYGFFAGLLILAARVGALYLLSEQGILFSALVAGFLIAPLSGRLAAALIPLWVQPARQTGLGSLMRGFSLKRVMAGAAVGFAPMFVYGALSKAWLLLALSFGATLVASAASGFFFARMYKNKVGGFTGDALGAAIETGETAALLLLGIAINLLGGLPI